MPLGFGRPNVSTVNGRFLSGDLDGLEFGIALGLDFDFHVHVEEVEILFRLADDPESFLGAVDHILQIEFRNARGMQPLREKWPQAGAVPTAAGGRVAQS